MVGADGLRETRGLDMSVSGVLELGSERASILEGGRRGRYKRSEWTVLD